MVPNEDLSLALSAGVACDTRRPSTLPCLPAKFHHDDRSTVCPDCLSPDSIPQ